MLSLNQTFDDARNIKVLVVPIGNNSLFENHFQLISRLKDVPFYELNRPVSKNTNPAFKYFDWNNGNLVFEYLRYDRVARGPGDLDNFQSSKRVLMIMGLINYPELGDSLHKIEEEMDYFSRRHPNILLRRLFVFNYSFDVLPGLRPVSPPRGLSDDVNSLVIFPPEGICEDGTSMLEVHLNEVMGHAAVRIITSLERQMEVCEEGRVRNALPGGVTLSTNYDDLEELTTTPTVNSSTNSMSNSSTVRSDSISSSNTTSRSSNVNTTGGMRASSATNGANSNKPLQILVKKRPAGRIRKWMGDLSLQVVYSGCVVCSPMDAIEHYIPSIAECRQNGDMLWLAGALDGYASAVLLLLQQVAQGVNISIEDVIGKDLKTITPVVDPFNPSPPSGGTNDLAADGQTTTFPTTAVEKAYRLAEERANEAVSIYAKSIVFCSMEVEGTLRLARMYETSAVALPSKEQMVLEYVMRAVAVPGLNTQQSIECILEGALIFHRIGLRKKYGFFLYIAALMCADNDNYSVAHALTQYAVNEFGLSSGAEDASAVDLTCTHEDNSVGHVQPSLDRVGVTDTSHSWAAMRTVLLSNSVLMAREHGDSVAAARFLSALMRLMASLESRQHVTRSQWATVTQKYFGLDNNSSAGGANESVSTHNNGVSTTNGNTRSVSMSRENNGVPHSSEKSNLHSQSLTEDSLRKLQHSSDKVSSTMQSDRQSSADVRSGSISQQLNFNSISNSSTNNGSNVHVRRQSLGSVISNANDHNGSADGNNKNRLLFPIMNMSSSNTNTRQSSVDGSSSSATSSMANGGPFRSPLAVRSMHDSNANSNNKTRHNIEDLLLNPNAVNNLAADFANATVEGFRSFAVPKIIPSKLIQMANKTRDMHNSSPLLHNHSSVSNTNHESGLIEKRPNEMMKERIKRHLYNDPLIVKKTIISTTATAYDLTGLASPSTVGDNNSNTVKLDTHYVSDVMAALSGLLQSTFIPADQQGDIMDLFATLNRNLDSCTNINLPVTVLSLRPLELNKHLKPCVVDCEGLGTARQSLALLQERWTKLSDVNSDDDDEEEGTSSAATSTSVVTTKKADASALFYDPFAAARAKRAVKSTEAVLWPADCSECSVVVVFSNSLAVPVVLTNVVPLIDVIHTNTHHENAANEANTSAYYRLFPTPVTIPPNTPYFEVELRVKPLVEGVSLKFNGVQVFMSNAAKVTLIDEQGNVPPSETRQELSAPSLFPHPATEDSELVKKKFGAYLQKKNSSFNTTPIPRGVAINTVKIVSSAPSWQIAANWVGDTLNSNSFTGDGRVNTASSSNISAKFKSSSSAVSNTNTISGTGSDSLSADLTLDLCPGESRRESVSLMQILGHDLEHLFPTSVSSSSSSSKASLVSDYRVTLTQYPAATTTAPANTTSKRITSTALHFHSSLQPAHIVSVEDSVAVVVDPLNKVSSKVIDVVSSCTLVKYTPNNTTSTITTTTTNDATLVFDFHYSPHPLVVEVEIEVVSSGESAAAVVKELNSWYDSVSHSSTSHVKDTNKTISENKTLLSLVTTANSATTDHFTLYSRKVTLRLLLTPCKGVHLSSVKEVRNRIQGSEHEVDRLLTTLCASTSSDSGAFLSDVPQQSGKTLPPPPAAAVALNSDVRVRVLSDASRVTFQLANSSTQVMFVATSRSALHNAIRSGGSDAGTTNILNKTLNYCDLTARSSSEAERGQIVAVIPPQSVCGVVVVYPYSVFRDRDSAGEDVRLLWGFADTTHTSSTTNTNIRCGFVELSTSSASTPQSLTVVHTSTISNTNNSNNSNNASLVPRGVSLSSRDALLRDLFRRRPPLSVATAVVPDKSLHVNDSNNTSSSDINSNSDNTDTVVLYQRVNLRKYVDLCVRVDLVRNALYETYFKTASSSTTSAPSSSSASSLLQVEVSLVIVSAQDPVVVEEGLFTDGGETDSLNIATRNAITTSQLRQTAHASECYLTSGKSTGVLRFNDDTTSAADSLLQFKQRVCFLVQGSYAVYSCVRVVGGNSDWWTLPEPVRVVAY